MFSYSDKQHNNYYWKEAKRFIAGEEKTQLSQGWVKRSSMKMKDALGESYEKIKAGSNKVSHGEMNLDQKNTWADLVFREIGKFNGYVIAHELAQKSTGLFIEEIIASDLGSVFQWGMNSYGCKESKNELKPTKSSKIYHKNPSVGYKESGGMDGWISHAPDLLGYKGAFELRFG